MTAQEIITAARRRYNAVGDSFYSDDELLEYVYQAELELSHKKVIKRTYTTTSASGTAEYAFPTNAFSIFRLEYDGDKLKPITFREKDALTLSVTSTTGKSAYYTQFGDAVTLVPTPDDALTITMYTYDEPAAVAITSTPDSPSIFHMDIVDYVLKNMVEKDNNLALADRLSVKWAAALEKAERWEANRKSADSFAAVQDEDTLDESVLGIV